ncbi:MAG TPA: hypothetical protein VKQ32_09255 [Polyangia bacterium]|nr:hypothetical protein [Polyangia bacterium]
MRCRRWVLVLAAGAIVGACGSGKSTGGHGGRGGGGGGLGGGVGGAPPSTVVDLPTTLISTPCRWFGVGRVGSIQYSGDGSLVGVRDHGRYIKIHRADSWDPVVALPPYGIEPLFAFTAGGTVAISGQLGTFGQNTAPADGGAATDAAVRFYRVSDGSLQGEIALGSETAIQLASARDGSFLLGVLQDMSGRQFRLVCWDVAGRTERWTTPLPGFAPSAEGGLGLAVAYDDSQIAFSNGGLNIVRPSDGSTIWSDANGGAPLAFSRDGQSIAGGSLLVWNTSTHVASGVISSGAVDSLAFSGAGDVLFLGHAWNRTSAGMDAQIQAVRPATNTSAGITFTAHKLDILALALSPDGGELASGGSDPAVHISDAASGALKRSIPGHANLIYALSASPAAGLLLSGAEEPDVLLWNIGTGGLVARFPIAVSAATLSADGSSLAAEDIYDQMVSVVDVASGATRATFSADTKTVFALSPDGARMALGRSTGAVDLYNVADQSLVWTGNAAAGPIGALDFSSDGGSLALLASKGTEVEVWRVTDGTAVMKTQVFAANGLSYLSTVRLSPDGSSLFGVGGAVNSTATGEAGVVLSVRVADGSVSSRTARWSTGLSYLAVSPDGLSIATEGVTTVVWRASDLTPLYAVDSYLYHLAFLSPTEIASGEQNNSISVWCAPPSP